MFFISKLFSSFFLCFGLLVFTSVVTGKPNVFNQKTLKQLIFSGANEVALLDANSCGDLNHDIDSKCPIPDADASCSELQDYINCARDVVEEDCGDNATVEFCDTFNAGMEQSGNPCHVKCTAVNAKS